MGREKNTRLVYSTGGGRVQQPDKKASQAPPSDGVVRISRQTKGRKGKGMSIITGIPLADGELRDLARELKQSCGTGGTVKNGTIEIQGDHRDKLMAELQSRGYTVKKAGG